MPKLIAALFVATASLVVAPAALADVKITDHTYVSPITGVPNADPVLARCSTDNRQQNEPTASVNPTNPSLMAAGANDYCTVPTAGDTWLGLYYSSDGGASWVNSLVPGYRGDVTPEGRRSPASGLVISTGDPVQAWDNFGHLYYAGIGFNRQRPAYGSLFVARFTWQAGPRPIYEFTTLVHRGTPSPLFRGIFDDKIQIEVDKGVDSPYSGNVYICYARFTASAANNGVFFFRSTDGGRTFSHPMKLSESIHGSQFCDVAVTRTGIVFVAWRQFAFKPEQGQRQTDAVAWAKSTDGGATFTKPAIAQTFIGWDLTDRYGSPEEAGQAAYQACLAGDYGPGECEGAEPREPARSCGDGPFRCESGYVFARANTQVRITADPTAAGDPDAAYVVYDASVPGSLTPTGTTFGTVTSGVGSQASVYFIKTTNGGASWSAPIRIDPQAKGHQFFPDIDANNGVLHAFWQDSRNDCASGPTGTAGDFRTVPISNRWVPENPPGGVICSTAPPADPAAPGVDAFYATSSSDGASWTSSMVSTARTMPQYEQFGDRNTPFFGDYNYIDAASGAVFMNWTDQRDTIPGVDPRYPVDGMDGFDVLQCRTLQPNGTYGPDTCPDAGGLDQNIYGAILGG